MALFGPGRIPLVNIVRLKSHVLVGGVIAALLLSFAFSFAFTGRAAAAPSTCTFTATSSVRLSAITANRFGALDIVDATLTKYTDGCGHEYGALSGTSAGPYTSIAVTVSVGSTQSSASSLPFSPDALVTPIISGNSPACGTITFQAPPDAPGFGSNCTPS